MQYDKVQEFQSYNSAHLNAVDPSQITQTYNEVKAELVADLASKKLVHGLQLKLRELTPEAYNCTMYIIKQFLKNEKLNLNADRTDLAALIKFFDEPQEDFWKAFYRLSGNSMVQKLIDFLG